MNNWAKDALDRLLSMSSVFETTDDRLTINVSGTRYEINVSDLYYFPDTILGDPLKRARYLVPNKNEYFFPRHPSSFESILYYYINDGILIKSEIIPALVFYEEIRFFQLNPKLIQIFYNDYLSINENYSSQQTYFNRILNLLSAIFNALSIYSLCLETTNIYRNIRHTTWIITHPIKARNRTEGFQCSDFTLRPYQYVPHFNTENQTLELICMTWFYIELIIRTLSSSSFINLLNDPKFLLDILSIFPTVLCEIVYRYYIGNDKTMNENLKLNETRLFDYIICLKAFRLFRLTRHSKCLEIFVKVFYTNLKDFLMLTVLILFGVFYFGLTQFVLEQIHEENEFHNIGEALWHGFTVIITVGYSDFTEHQFLSYIFAIIGVCYGAISMAIILPNITQSFTIFHNLRYRRHVLIRQA